jgi:KDO2-lipid IV(A) lauroyltransferase
VTGSSRAKATYLLYRSLGTALQLMPEPMADAAAAVVGEAMARRKAGPRELRARHLERVLSSSSPVVKPDPQVVARWTRRSFRAYARYWVEGARLPATGIDRVNQRMLFERGYEHLERGMEAGRGVVLVLPHIGSWEWGGAFIGSQGYPMTSVAERIEPPALFDWFVKEREAIGLTILPLGSGSTGTILATLRNGGLVGLLSDRDIAGGGVPVRFFGEMTTFPGGPATLALRSGATLMAAAVYSGPGKDHMAVVTPPFDTARTGSFRTDVTRITQDIALQFEHLVRRAPEQWHIYQPLWPSDPPARPGDERH